MDVVTAHLPGLRVHSVELLGEGLDNTAYLVNDELVVRFSKESDPTDRAARIVREVALLAVVADVCPVSVPAPTVVAPDLGCLAYPKLPGVPLADLGLPADAARAAAIAASLGDLLASLHAVPPERVAGLVEPDDQPTSGWREDAAALYAAVANAVPAHHRRSIEIFLATPPPADRAELVFSHNDIGIEHVLVDPATGLVTGVIDWSDAALTDSAYGIGLLCRDLGDVALTTAVDRLRHAHDQAFSLRERAVFYARCSVLEDFAYGLETGRQTYTDRGLAALNRLFPP
ncbi:bifunctional AAC/APH [Protofrankia sp. BMG5.30]|uniref:Bifunctional AAC/APH n=1 Tax=Protofrankia coriariae TaxID=1562887 RepID=A0ABR5EYJ0_9ACTN|nr:bifunctional AAC/APH [Protofrankia coriariae]ONH30733.1 bifunctional AAC/APH [Protofrankia sp. BMG5.30]